MFIVEPVLLDTQLRVVCAQWSHNGAVLAIGGQYMENKDNSFICFYTPLGSVCLTLFLSEFSFDHALHRSYL